MIKTDFNFNKIVNVSYISRAGIGSLCGFSHKPVKKDKTVEADEMKLKHINYFT